MFRLKRFQNDISSMRSHHWKYYLDAYDSCYYNCKYCLYYSKKVTHSNMLLSEIESDFLEIQDVKGIVYLGATADVYQPHEKETLYTRNILKLCLKYNVPLFIVTRSNLILRDIDILKELSRKGMVEVSITINTKNIRFRNCIEPNTILHESRLNVAATLSQNGIKTSFHFSPILPYLDNENEINEMLMEMCKTGCSCIYACIFGMSKSAKGIFIKHLKKFDVKYAKKILEIYSQDNSNTNTLSPPDEDVFKIMNAMSTFCNTNKIPFICAQIPDLDTTVRENGIFQYKLPTVGDIVHHFEKLSLNTIYFSNLDEYFETFCAVDNYYRDSVKKYWKNGELFKNSKFVKRVVSNSIIYIKSDEALIDTSVMSCSD